MIETHYTEEDALEAARQVSEAERDVIETAMRWATAEVGQATTEAEIAVRRSAARLRTERRVLGRIITTRRDARLAAVAAAALPDDDELL